MKKHLFLFVMLLVIGVTTVRAEGEKTYLGTLAYLTLDLSTGLSDRMEFEVHAPSESMAHSSGIYGPGQPRIESASGSTLKFSINVKMFKFDVGSESGRAVYEIPVDKWFNNRDWSYTTDWSSVMYPSGQGRNSWTQCNYEIVIYFSGNKFD